MPPTLELDRVRPSDLPELARLEAASFDSPWSERELAAELALPWARLWVARAPACRPTAPLLGFAAFRWNGFEGELLRIAVDPEARRQGIARALLEAGLAWLVEAGASHCHLEVRAGNAGAVTLYERYGFERAGRRAGYYSDGEDALLMSLALAAPRTA